MEDNFEHCLTLVLREEGGFSDNPDDPGGATNLGATQGAWAAYKGHPVTVADIKALTRADVDPFYCARYWAPAGCTNWPPGVDLIVFDMAVNQGVDRAIRCLQSAAGVSPDGVIGPYTRAAVAAADPGALIDAIADRREAIYRRLPTFAEFGEDWLRRVGDMRRQAREMIGPVG